MSTINQRLKALLAQLTTQRQGEHCGHSRNCPNPCIYEEVDDLKMGNNVVLVGEAERGKTTLAEKMSK